MLIEIFRLFSTGDKGAMQMNGRGMGVSPWLIPGNGFLALGFSLSIPFFCVWTWIRWAYYMYIMHWTCSLWIKDQTEIHAIYDPFHLIFFRPSRHLMQRGLTLLLRVNSNEPLSHSVSLSQMTSLTNLLKRWKFRTLTLIHAWTHF